MEYNILFFANNILWRPDYIPNKLANGTNIFLLYIYILIYI